MKLYSITDAAQEIGVHKSTISRACAKHGFGTRIGAAGVALTEAEVKRLRTLCPGKPGNPNFVPGNYFGQPPKRRKKS
jgi:hypothetical protein